MVSYVLYHISIVTSQDLQKILAEPEDANPIIVAGARLLVPGEGLLTM